ncbi:MAG: thiamine pyrophosphate-requiring protein [Pseudomonadota bacterium]|nr:thiamine pyrophosphate-requiring protein [Pseudomonadota bacterium]|tara:strand:- start:570 stop:2219 length:1650 start_codon:yes stop_codon:yes gene_type:complete
MKVLDAIITILKKEGLECLNCFPTTPIIEAAAAQDIKPIVCRQERVGLGIADAYSRVTNGKKLSAFAMQYGPGAENAYPGVATAFSDSTPLLVLPLGHPLDRDGVFPMFSSLKSYESITKSIEQITTPSKSIDVLRRAIASMRNGRPGPAMVEIPEDILSQDIEDSRVENYKKIQFARSMASSEEITNISKIILSAKNPIIIAGAGVLYAEATRELAEFAELLQIPVMTTMEGKSSISERNHPLALGSGSGVMSDPVVHFMKKSDVVIALGTSLTKHPMVTTIPPGKIIIHNTNDPKDLYKSYDIDCPVLGDTKLVLEQLIESCRDYLSGKIIRNDVPEEIFEVRKQYLENWSKHLDSKDKPISPYRVISEFMKNIDPKDAIVTHDAGSPRYQIMPFYQSDTPRSYLGWGKSHQLGTGLGFAIGAKLAAPDKFCVNFMGDAAFGMTGLDFETAVRTKLPITTIVLKNSTMAIETNHMKISHEKFKARDLDGDYADIARSLGGWSEVIDDPEDIASSLLRAKEKNQEGISVLLQFNTSKDQNFANMRPFG